MLCGLTLFALPATVFGAIGIAELLRRDHEDGTLLATFGLLLGVLELAALIVVFTVGDFSLTETFT
ncbi:hypothetical protein OK17_18240 [Gordonia sp. GN26]